MFLEEMANPQTIIEADDDYGRKLYFNYQKLRKGQEEMSYPNPEILYLGTWRMTDKQGIKKTFICGLNLAYLGAGDVAAVQHALPDILKSKNMKTRYQTGKSLLPDLFRQAYRTYNVNNVVARPVRGRIYALKSNDEDKEQARELATKDAREWGELEQDERKQYLDKAIRSRGEGDVEKQDKARVDRDKMEIDPQANAVIRVLTKVLTKQTERQKEELSVKPKPPKLPAKPKPSKLPAKPKPSKLPAKPKAFEPLELGPGYEKPEPAIIKPTKNIETGMVNPRRVKSKPTAPDIEEFGGPEQLRIL